MRYLCRLITPPNGVVLDMFGGSGSTGKGALAEGFRCILIEREEESVITARARCAHAEAAFGPPIVTEPADATPQQGTLL